MNIDVANTCFWARTSLIDAAIAVLGFRDVQQLNNRLKPVPAGHGSVTTSRDFNNVQRRLRGLSVQPHYRGCPVANMNFVVKGLVNGNSRGYKIDVRSHTTGATRRISVEQYFKEKYNLIIGNWELPVVEMTKKGVVYPMEVLAIHGLHRYTWKLNDYQTSAMIRYAACRPADRMYSITKAQKMLDHANDPMLNYYGLQVSSSLMRTKARLLPSPDLQFGGNQRINPGTTGRWDLRGKKFYAANRLPLESWGIGFFSGRRNSVNRAQVEKFRDSLMKTYAVHGGSVARPGIVVELMEEIEDAIQKLYMAVGNNFRKEPQMLLVVVPDKTSSTYLTIKRSMDCSFGVPSQVLQSSHVMKGNPQYISNVLTKVNAKLGGSTARTIPKEPAADMKPLTMIIGADVSHASLGVSTPSLAAMSICTDMYGVRYSSSCGPNGDGDHVEIIAKENIRKILEPLIKEWVATVGQGCAPQRVLYFRDGVSQGEYNKVLQAEVPHIRNALSAKTNNRFKGALTVVIATKRHHIRATPNLNDRKAADRNGNPLPGTLISRDVTSPHDWDFLLYTHTALQGTARPVHYHVILDENRHKPQELENMVNDHCYQYIRSTTSVSIRMWCFLRFLKYYCLVCQPRSSLLTSSQTRPSTTRT